MGAKGLAWVLECWFIGGRGRRGFSLSDGDVFWILMVRSGDELKSIALNKIEVYAHEELLQD